MPLQSSQPLELVSSMQVVPARQCNSVPCLYLCICLCSWAVSSLPPYALLRHPRLTIDETPEKSFYGGFLALGYIASSVRKSTGSRSLNSSSSEASPGPAGCCDDAVVVVLVPDVGASSSAASSSTFVPRPPQVSLLRPPGLCRDRGVFGVCFGVL